MTTTRPRWATIAASAAALAAVSLLSGPSRAAAQDIDVGRRYQVRDDASAVRAVSDYQRHRSAGEWEDAVHALQRLLDRPWERGDLVRVRDEGPARFEGVNARGRRLFEELPPEGVEVWERLYRPKAEELLSRGLRLRRDVDLRDVARGYPARDVRRRAHEALASLALSRGAFAEAAFELRSLLAVSPGAEERAGVLARLAFARAQSGDREGTERVRALSADVLDQVVPGPEGAESLELFIDRMELAAGPRRESRTGWPEFGGNRHGTALAPPPPPPGAKSRWRLPTLYVEGSATDDDKPSRWSISQVQGHRPVAPVVAQGMVFVNNGLSMRAVDLSTGRMVWRKESRQRVANWRDNKLAVHTASVADDVVYAALATRSDAPKMERKFYGRTIVYALPHRSLYALDARTGAVLWSHEDTEIVDHPDRDAITEESVASPPLVVGDDILVATYTYDSIFDVRLVCFDRHTGRTRWRRSIVQGQQELNLFGRPVKELATTALAEHDGVVYFGTSLGVATGVDLARGEVQWVTAYPQTRIPPSNYWYETRERQVTWWPSPVSATHSRIVMAPTESAYLMAFDPIDGRVHWKTPNMIRPFDHDYFLGVADGRAFILGERLTAIDLETGARAWNSPDAGRLLTPDMRDTSATGAGVIGDGRVYVPTDESIVSVDTRTGDLKGMWPLPDADLGEPVGNLVSADGAALLVERDEIVAHYRFEQRRDRLLAQIVAAPDDAQLRLEAGQIFRSAGQLDDAISSLEIGLQRIDALAPRARERLEGPLRRALHESLVERAAVKRELGDAEGALGDLEWSIGIAQDRGQAVRALLSIAEIATDQRARRALERVRAEYAEVHVALPGIGRVHAGAKALFELGENARAAGDGAAAADLWLDLLEQHADADLGRADARSAVHDRLRRLTGEIAVAAAERVRLRARAAFELAREAADAVDLDRVARIYPDAQIAAKAALLGAKLHLTAERPREAVGLLRSLLNAEPGAAETAAALWRLSDAYAQLEEVAAERMTLQRLLREHPEVALDDGDAGALARARLKSARLSTPPADLPALHLPLSQLWSSDATSVAPQIVVLPGRRPTALEGRLLATRGGVLELLDASTGRPVWRQPLDLERRTAVGTRDTFVLAGDPRGRGQRGLLVQSFSAADGTEVWRKQLPGGYRADAAGLGVLYLLHTERDAQGGVTYTLTALDVSAGSVLASRTFDGPLYPEITVAEDAVVVYRSARTRNEAARTILTLDSATLTLRGSTDLETSSFNHVAVHPPQSGIVVTLAGSTELVAVDVSDGSEAWRVKVPKGDAKKLLAVTGAVIVADTEGGIHRIAASNGHILWSADVSSIGTLGWNGEAAVDGTVVVTVVPDGRRGQVVAVALDGASGDELWRHRIEHEGRAHPHPVICTDHVAYEVNESFGGRTRRYACKVILLERGDGSEAAIVEHPEIGAKYQRVLYDRTILALTVPGALAVYGSR